MAARIAVERIIDLRYTLRSFGVPLDGPAWLFGDNKSVVTSSTIPHSTLGKRWNALSYHRVCEAIAGGWLRFEHIPGTENPADVLTKSLAWATMRQFVEPLLLWKGDTADAPSGSHNPEGSDADPGHGWTRVTDGSHGTNETNPGFGVPLGQLMDSDTRDLRDGRDAPVVPLLWNNQYAALAYDST